MAKEFKLMRVFYMCVYQETRVKNKTIHHIFNWLQNNSDQPLTENGTFPQAPQAEELESLEHGVEAEEVFSSLPFSVVLVGRQTELTRWWVKMPTARGHTHSLADWLSPKPRKCADHREARLSAAGHWGKELAAATCTGRHSFMKSSAWAKDKTPHAPGGFGGETSSFSNWYKKEVKGEVCRLTETLGWLCEPPAWL